MNATEIIGRVTQRLLYPLVRVMLRHGIPFNEFAELARMVYVKVGMREFQISGRKQTVSRVAVLTGLSRKEVLRIQRLSESAEVVLTKAPHRVERVISGWVRDPDFIDEDKAPAILPMLGDGATFEELVRRYSGDMTRRAVLDELLRTDIVECLDDDRVKLLKRAYIPGGGELEKLPILGSDVRDLVVTIDHNLSTSPEGAWLQRTLAYDNLPEEYVQQLRKLVTEDGQKFLERWDSEMAQHDQDVTPSDKASSRTRAVIGIYYLDEPYSDYKEEQE